jgi:hypothetical protein
MAGCELGELLKATTASYTGAPLAEHVPEERWFDD